MDGFDLFFGEFSINFPDEFSVEKGKPRVVVRRVKKSLNFHDPWVGTDTPGYGEAVFAGQDLQKQAGRPKLRKLKSS